MSTYTTATTTRMSFRQKMKKVFSGKKSGEDSPSTDGSGTPNQRSDIKYYKPGQVPPSRYRGPWNQKHQDHLHSFSFSEAFGRRKSSLPSVYSPMGNKAQSRRTSWLGVKSRPSTSGRSVKSGKSDVKDDLLRAKSNVSDVGRVNENAEDEAGVANVGGSLSNIQTGAPVDPQQKDPTSKDEASSSTDQNDLTLARTISDNPITNLALANDTPFTAQELERAMTRATVRSTTPKA